MSSLAQIMHELGYNVTGSDKPDHFFTEVGLVKNNIPFTGYNEENIDEEYASNAFINKFYKSKPAVDSKVSQ